jgi:hypothetical protein
VRISRYNIEPKKTHETVSSGITFEMLDSIKSEGIGELALRGRKAENQAFGVKLLANFMSRNIQEKVAFNPHSSKG